MIINKECGEMTNTSQKPKFEYGMNEQLKNLLTEIKTCAFSVLIDKGYTKDKADKAIAKIKNFNVYETETGFRIETLVDEYKITVFQHTDEIKVDFYCNEEQKMNTKTVTINDENDALNQGRIVSTCEHQTNNRLEKFENWLSSLQSLVDTLTNDTQSNINSLKGRIKRLDKYDLFLYDKINEIGNNLENIKDSFISLGDDLKTE